MSDKGEGNSPVCAFMCAAIVQDGTGKPQPPKPMSGQPMSGKPAPPPRDTRSHQVILSHRCLLVLASAESLCVGCRQGPQAPFEFTLAHQYRKAKLQSEKRWWLCRYTQMQPRWAISTAR